MRCNLHVIIMVTRSRVRLSSFLVLVGLQMGVEADPGPDYSCAVRAGESGGGGFELNLFDGCALLSLFIQYSALTDKFYPCRTIF